MVCSLFDFVRIVFELFLRLVCFLLTVVGVICCLGLLVG